MRGFDGVKLGVERAKVLALENYLPCRDLAVRRQELEQSEGRKINVVGLRYADPGLEPDMSRVYPTPWTRCDREDDYRHAARTFEDRLS